MPVDPHALPLGHVRVIHIKVPHSPHQDLHNVLVRAAKHVVRAGPRHRVHKLCTVRVGVVAMARRHCLIGQRCVGAEAGKLVRCVRPGVLAHVRHVVLQGIGERVPIAIGLDLVRLQLTDIDLRHTLDHSK